jgi:hypothetical protein
MSEFDLVGIPASFGASDLPVPKEKLDGKEILLRCFMYSILSVKDPTDDIDLAEELWASLAEIADFSNGTMDGEWICFNVKSGELGMAYPYNGEWRIREHAVSDEQIRSVQQRRVDARRFNNQKDEVEDEQG